MEQNFFNIDDSTYSQVWISGESAVGLPFIDVYFRSTALLDVRNPINILYELFHDRENFRKTTYAYDPLQQRLFAMETEGGSILRSDTLATEVPYYDGPGLFMMTRCAAGSDTTLVLPTVMDFALGYTTIAFSSAIQTIEVNAFDRHVPSHRYTGTTSWKGSSFAGMTGEFSGWVSAHPTRTLLRADIRIFLGSVTIELESREQQ